MEVVEEARVPSAPYWTRPPADCSTILYVGQCLDKERISSLFLPVWDIAVYFFTAGISLSMDQWEALKKAIPNIDAKIHGS